jgi:hypothetical protein
MDASGSLQKPRFTSTLPTKMCPDITNCEESKWSVTKHLDKSVSGTTMIVKSGLSAWYN